MTDDNLLPDANDDLYQKLSMSDTEYKEWRWIIDITRRMNKNTNENIEEENPSDT